MSTTEALTTAPSDTQITVPAIIFADIEAALAHASREVVRDTARIYGMIDGCLFFPNDKIDLTPYYERWCATRRLYDIFKGWPVSERPSRIYFVDSVEIIVREDSEDAWSRGAFEDSQRAAAAWAKG